MSKADKKLSKPQTVDTLAHKLHVAGRLNWVCYIGMLLLCAAWNLLGGTFPGWIMIFPLLLVLPGLLKGHNRSYLWLCFILLIYIAASIVDVMMPGRGWRHGLLLVLSFTLFISAMMTSRWQRLLASTQS